MDAHLTNEIFSDTTCKHLILKKNERKLLHESIEKLKTSWPECFGRLQLLQVSCPNGFDVLQPGSGHWKFQYSF